MIIRIQLPRESEATYTINSEDGVIEITPFFHKAQGIKSVAGIEVEGKSGRKTQAVLLVSGRTGAVRTQEAKQIETDFDSAPSPKTPKKPKPKPDDSGVAP